MEQTYKKDFLFYLEIEGMLVSDSNSNANIKKGES